ncbi:MAG: hypothetical protein M1817_005783 [Caeruleum heppii]|nr:MAG: hypothetical protein M1817_005783 [Caeruleum heppii]
MPGGRSSNNFRLGLLRQRLGQRSYASGAAGPKKASGDLPWLIGSIAITIPTCAYLLQAGSKNSHHGHDDSHGHDAADTEHDKQDDAGSDKDGDDQSDAKEDGGEETQDDSEDSSDQGKAGGQEESTVSGQDEESGSGKKSPVDDGFDETDKSENVQKDAGQVKEEGSGVEGVRFKGATKDGATEDERRLIPDNKGGNKRRINSAYGKSLGQPEDGSSMDEEEAGKSQDKPTPSKTPLNRNHQSGKQEGISNTDTKHSADLDNMPDKSKKGEGGPDTAKVKGTVRTDRPQR